MDIVSTLALATGLSWASGFRLYFATFAIGVLGYYRYIALPDGLDILTHPMVIAVSGVLLIIEFVADKFPYIDSTWDGLQTFIRIPAGALLAMGAFNSSDPVIAAIVALLGGTLAGATHLTKAGSRVFINTSPEPVSNVTTSLAEDTAVIFGGWLALMYPVVFLGFILLLILLMIWLLPKLWRGLRRAGRRLYKNNDST